MTEQTENQASPMPEAGAEPPTGGATPDRHPLLVRLIHWLSVLVVGWMLLSGVAFWLLEWKAIKEMFGGDVTGQIYFFHKSFGVLLLLLVILRLIVRFALPRPAPMPGLPAKQERVALVVQTGLYLVMLGVPLSGWLGTSAGGFPINFFFTNLPPLVAKNHDLAETVFTAHLIGGLVMLLLVGLHVGAAFFHKLVLKNGMLRRISLP